MACHVGDVPRDNKKQATVATSCSSSGRANRKSLAEGGPLETIYTVIHQDWQGKSGGS